MKTSINDNRKTRGRPATGTAPLVGVRMTEEFQDAIRAWAQKQSDNPALATAIRRLVELGLTVKLSAKRQSSLKAARATELATKMIEKIIDPSAPPEERAQRRRRLTKGPSEFREDRIDLLEAKLK
jgi:hypothetical protein